MSLWLRQALIEKGANPNHQNREGQTAGHFANAYGFYDFLAYLFEPAPEGGGADDSIANRFGLTAYDGMRPEGSEA